MEKLTEKEIECLWTDLAKADFNFALKTLINFFERSYWMKMDSSTRPEIHTDINHCYIFEDNGNRKIDVEGIVSSNEKKECTLNMSIKDGKYTFNIYSIHGDISTVSKVSHSDYFIFMQKALNLICKYFEIEPIFPKVKILDLPNNTKGDFFIRREI
jgi:hypothetical protein